MVRAAFDPHPVLIRLFQFSASASLTAAALLATPVALAHVGHGDEFQQQGEVRQVPSNPDADALLGVTTAKPEPGADGLTVPSAAVVDADGTSLLFVKTEKTYDPVVVEIGANFGDRVVITKGLDPTDEVVVAGALSLYAESKKTQQLDPEQASKTEATNQGNTGVPAIALIAGAVVIVGVGGVLISRRSKSDV